MKKIIAIHRPLGADLQPLIFRIPRVFLAFFYLRHCLQRGGERGQVGWKGLLSEKFGLRLMCEEVANMKRPRPGRSAWS